MIFVIDVDTSEWHHHVILKAFNLSVATIWWDLQFDEPTCPTAKVIKMLKKIQKRVSIHQSNFSF